MLTEEKLMLKLYDFNNMVIYVFKDKMENVFAEVNKYTDLECVKQTSGNTIFYGENRYIRKFKMKNLSYVVFEDLSGEMSSRYIDKSNCNLYYEKVFGMYFELGNDNRV